MSVQPAGNRNGRSTIRRKRPVRWGVVLCPDGRRNFDLDIMRGAMTGLIAAGELVAPGIGSLASRVGLGRATVSRLFHGHPVGIASLLAVLAVLGLTFEEVTASAAIPVEERTGT